MASVTTPVVFGFLAAVAAAASAAQMPSIPGLGGGVPGLPNVSNIGVGNAAGLLGYCMKNDFLGGTTGAGPLVDSLTKKPGVTDSKDFAAGQAGNILMGDKSSFSLAGAADPIKQQGCKMVLEQAHKFL